MTTFELEAVGGPWAKRARKRMSGLEDLPWNEVHASEEALAQARIVWTQSAFSEYASAASFAEIASALLAANAPIDLVAAAGEFVADEMLHAELSARIAVAFGGAIALDVNLEKLVRPPSGATPLLRAAELVVRTSCVGEALTVPILKSAKAVADCPLVERIIGRILKDESAHAELGFWFLDWADARLTEADRVHLTRVAEDAIASFAPLLETATCERASKLGSLDCTAFDATFHAALEHRVRAPLRAHGICTSGA